MRHEAVTEVRERPADGYADVYAQRYADMVRLAALTTGSASLAEELVQDAFAQLCRRWAEVAEPERWLRRAVVSQCTSWVRRRVLERRHAGTTDVPSPVDITDPDALAVRAALACLTPRQRAAVFLRYYADLPEAEIAASLGCRPGTVKSLLNRGLAAMREHLDD